MVRDELVFSAAGDTDSQLPPEVVEALVVNCTSEEGTDVVKMTVCDSAVVDPCVAEGVQAAGLGVTVGGALPVVTSVAPVRLKTVGVPVPSAALIVPVTLAAGMSAGTSEIINPVGMVTLAVMVAIPRTLQLLIPMVSGAPTLSVKMTVAGLGHMTGVELAVFA
jgi:hypothetical protein